MSFPLTLALHSVGCHWSSRAGAHGVRPCVRRRAMTALSLYIGCLASRACADLQRSEWRLRRGEHRIEARGHHFKNRRRRLGTGRNRYLSHKNTWSELRLTVPNLLTIKPLQEMHGFDCHSRAGASCWRVLRAAGVSRGPPSLVAASEPMRSPVSLKRLPAASCLPT